MKTDIHPKYYPNATVVCACGNTFTIGSTKEKIEVEICSNCHPFFTGTEKIIDSAGRVEKFKSRAARAVGPKVKKEKVRKAGKANKGKISIKQKPVSKKK